MAHAYLWISTNISHIGAAVQKTIFHLDRFFRQISTAPEIEAIIEIKDSLF
jgi:hypothetical protein